MGRTLGVTLMVAFLSLGGSVVGQETPNWIQESGSDFLIDVSKVDSKTLFAISSHFGMSSEGVSRHINKLREIDVDHDEFDVRDSEEALLEEIQMLRSSTLGGKKSIILLLPGVPIDVSSYDFEKGRYWFEFSWLYRISGESKLWSPSSASLHYVGEASIAMHNPWGNNWWVGMDEKKAKIFRDRIKDGASVRIFCADPFVREGLNGGSDLECIVSSFIVQSSTGDDLFEVQFKKGSDKGNIEWRF